MIIISFKDDSLNDMCADLGQAELVLGSIGATALTNFISEAEAFENAEELIDFYGNGIEISEDDSLFVSIGLQHRATFVVVGSMFKRGEDRRIAWATATRLKLVDVSRWP